MFNEKRDLLGDAMREMDAEGASNMKSILDENAKISAKIAVEHPEASFMATVESFKSMGPMVLIGVKCKPVTVEAYEISIMGNVLATVPQNVIHDCLRCSKEGFEAMQKMFDDIDK